MARPPVPLEVTRAPMRTVRPKDLSSVYITPQPELDRLMRGGSVRRLAHGYYAAIPDDRGPRWRPTAEAAGAAVAAAIFGVVQSVLIGVSAARIHHAIPRGIGVVVVAVPRQHRPIDLAGGGEVRFVKRDVDRLDARQQQLDELGRGLVATPEQTVIDIAHRHEESIERDLEDEAIRALLPRCDQYVLERLASDQRRMASLERARALVR